MNESFPGGKLWGEQSRWKELHVQRYRNVFWNLSVVYCCWSTKWDNRAEARVLSKDHTMQGLEHQAKEFGIVQQA